MLFRSAVVVQVAIRTPSPSPSLPLLFLRHTGRGRYATPIKEGRGRHWRRWVQNTSGPPLREWKGGKRHLGLLSIPAVCVRPRRSPPHRPLCRFRLALPFPLLPHPPRSSFGFHRPAWNNAFPSFQCGGRRSGQEKGQRGGGRLPHASSPKRFHAEGCCGTLCPMSKNGWSFKVEWTHHDGEHTERKAVEIHTARFSY